MLKKILNKLGYLDTYHDFVCHRVSVNPEFLHKMRAMCDDLLENESLLGDTVLVEFSYEEKQMWVRINGRNLMDYSVY